MNGVYNSICVLIKEINWVEIEQIETGILFKNGNNGSMGQLF